MNLMFSSSVLLGTTGALGPLQAHLLLSNIYIMSLFILRMFQVLHHPKLQKSTANFRTHVQSFRLHDNQNFRIAYSNCKKPHLLYVVIDKHKDCNLQSMDYTETNIIGKEYLA